MLRWRILVSCFVIPLLLGLFWLDTLPQSRGTPLLGLVLILAAGSVFELLSLIKSESMPTRRLLVTFCVLATIASNWLGMLAELPDIPAEIFPALGLLGPMAATFSLSCMLLFGHALFRFKEPGGNMGTLSIEMFALIYVGFFLGMTTQLRWVTGFETGYFVIGSLIIAAKSGDIGAYTLGRLFGKKKMAPILSPGKTWAGFVGALLFSGFFSWLWLTWGGLLFTRDIGPCPWYWAVLYGVAIGFVGLLGDLCESLIKRDSEKKDSSMLIPGFGGILDLLDSIIFAGPLAYVLWFLLPLRTW